MRMMIQLILLILVFGFPKNFQKKISRSQKAVSKVSEVSFFKVEGSRSIRLLIRPAPLF